LMLYLEPINSTHPLRIYITVTPSNTPSYIFTVQNQGNKYLRRVSELSPQSGYLALKGSSKLVLPNGDTYFTPAISSDPTKTAFSPLYPSKFLNPIWTPSFNIYSEFYKEIKLIVPALNEFKPNSYQFSFILSQKDIDFYIKFQDFEIIKKSTLVLDSSLYDKDGKLIKLSIKFDQVYSSLECDVNEFKLVIGYINNIKKKLSETNDISESINLIFNLDYLYSTDFWMNCRDKVNNYFINKLQTEEISIKQCMYSARDPEFATDPCCSPTQLYYQCCNPSPINVTFIQTIDFNNDLINNECLSAECTKSVLEEYETALWMERADVCRTSSFTVLKLAYSTTETIRGCKDVLISPICSKDSDCKDYGKIKKCNLYTRECIADFESIDKSYIKCVLENLSISSLFYLTNSTSFNSDTIDTLYNDHLSSDCVGSKSIMDRSTYSFFSPGLEDRYNKNYGCLDSTCFLKHDINFDFLTKLSFEKTPRDPCDNFGFCKSLPCTNSLECKNQCNAEPASFCGYCSDENLTQCHNLNSVTNQRDCENQSSLCLLPNGEILTGKTEKECTETYGECSYNNCGDISCTSIFDGVDSGCFINTSNETCLDKNGKFLDLKFYTICLLTFDQETCKNNNFDWIDCGSKLVGECSGGYDFPLVCTTKYSNKCNKAQCESIAGECSDKYFFSPDSNPLYPNGLGKCVGKHSNIEESIRCNYDENDSPEGCYSNRPKHFTKAKCEENIGSKWWSPALTKEDCISKYGCKTMLNQIPFMFTFNFKFNEMNEDTCNGCGVDSFNEWYPKYNWNAGTWKPGVYIKPKWINNQYISNKKSPNTFDYQFFYNSVQKTFFYQLNEFYRTENICRNKKAQLSMEKVLCSCIENNNLSQGNISQCFQLSDAPLILQINVCSGWIHETIFDFGKALFNGTASNQTCQEITLSHVSKQGYTSSTPETLASNFVSYKKPPSFALFNSKNATIGYLMSDGLMIQSSEGINQVEICFIKNKLLGNSNGDFPVIDIAFQIDNKTSPLPLEIPKGNINSTDSVYICLKVSNVPKGDPTYFLISRINDKDWKTMTKEIFDKQTKVLMYILAVIFLLISLFGLYEIITIIIFYFKKIIIQFQLIQILILIVTLFILIRTIYFFLLVNGKLQDNPVLDYILVVLPTFIYFTAFSSLIVLWYTIVFLFLKNNIGTGVVKKLYSIVITVNIILYLFFIAIVLVFQYTPLPPAYDCAGRVVTAKEASPSQKATNLTYAIVQAGLSFVISAAFIYLGRNLYKTISTSEKNLSNTKHQKKIFILSTICSVGFLLHCIFVIVLATDISSMTFSFIGLVITEVIPVVSIMYCFNPNDKNNNNNSSS
ncbi:hypothetical protein DICPUDRAFT_14748, partial [Dictyostelium purpureum]